MLFKNFDTISITCALQCCMHNSVNLPKLKYPKLCHPKYRCIFGNFNVMKMGILSKNNVISLLEWTRYNMVMMHKSWLDQKTIINVILLKINIVVRNAGYVRTICVFQVQFALLRLVQKMFWDLNFLLNKMLMLHCMITVFCTSSLISLHILNPAVLWNWHVTSRIPISERSVNERPRQFINLDNNHRAEKLGQTGPFCVD